MLTVDVVIPTWNRRDLILGALASLEAQGFAHRVYVVDNGSHDGTAEALARHHPATHVIALAGNEGFGRAVNRGIRAGTGELVVVLNNDVVCEPGFLAEISAPFTDPAVASVSGILLSADGGSIDAAGMVLDRSLAGYSHLHDAGLDVLGVGPPAMVPCAGAAAYRRVVLEAVGCFDEEIFAYSEDVDLGLRLLATGRPSVTAWNARVRHLGSATLGHRSENQLRLSAWSRGYLLGRYRVSPLLVAMELLIGLLDAVTVRNTIPLVRRVSGLVHGRRLSARPVPSAAYLSVRSGLAPRWAAFRRTAS